MTYKKMYLQLFNALTDAIRDLEKGEAFAAYLRMKQAQQLAEEQHLEVDIIPEEDSV